jgi:thiamine pyrophosphate-dependent acetolactate synthase large subunit-like protein
MLEVEEHEIAPRRFEDSSHGRRIRSLVGDVGPSLTLLADRLEGKLPRAGTLLRLREEILARITERAEESRYPLTPQRIVNDVRQVMPEDGIVCLDNGMYSVGFCGNPELRPGRVLCSWRLRDGARGQVGHRR